MVLMMLFNSLSYNKGSNVCHSKKNPMCIIQQEEHGIINEYEV